MFRKQPLPTSKLAQGCTYRPLTAEIIKGGTRTIFPINLDKVIVSDFDLDKQLKAGVELAPVNCKLLQTEPTAHEVQQFNDFSSTALNPDSEPDPVE